MAKSKADYYNEGAALARDTIAVENSINEPMRVTVGVSWQAREFAQGFNDELTILRGRFDSLQIMCAGEAARTARDDGGCLTFETVQAMSAAPSDQRIAPTTFVKPAPAVKIDNPPRTLRTGNPTFDARYSHVACLRADADKETNPVRAARLRAKANAITSRIWAAGAEA